MSTTPEFSEAQLASARATAWHQTGEPIVTLEAVREWVNNYGLVLFAPHAQTLGAPAPSLVEATLGQANAAPTAAQTETALALLARLVAEGSAVPLNLLGGAGDVPDFVASAQVFSFAYTLRGDKAWKQPPAQTGAVKVSPLALRVFEVLGEHGSLSAGALASELGREVNGSAVTRALGELWAQLRVLPRREGEGTVWELTTQRFTKAIKAGSNAGLPKALSALVSLYLHQAVSATEAEIEAFLSPLTARSRAREVVHALTGARELETLALEGKTMLYVADALPEFAGSETAQEREPDADGTAGAEGEQAQGSKVPLEEGAVGSEGSGERRSEERISQFKGAGSRGGDLRGKPFRPSAGRQSAGGEGRKTAGGEFRKTAGGAGRKGVGGGFSRGERSRPAAGARGGVGRPARAERPEGGSRPPARREPSAFTRPWEEDRRERPTAADGERPKRPSRPRLEGEAPRPFRTGKDSADRGEAQGQDRPAARRPSGDAPRREFRPRPGAEGRPGAFRREREGGPDRAGAAGGRPTSASSVRPSSRPGSRPKTRPTSRPASQPSSEADFRPRPASTGDRERTPGFAARSDRGPRPDRRPFSQAGGERAAGERAGGERGGGGSGERRPFRPRAAEGGGSRGDDFKGRRDSGPRPARPFAPARSSASARPAWKNRGDKPARGPAERERARPGASGQASEQASERGSAGQASAGPGSAREGSAGKGFSRPSFSDRPRRERPAGGEDSAGGPPSRGPKRFGAAPAGRPYAARPSGSRPYAARPFGTRAEGRAGGDRGDRSSARPARSASPAGAEGVRGRGERPVGRGGPRAAGGGFGSRGSKPPAGQGGARAPKKSAGAFTRAPRPKRRSDEPAGEA